MAARQQKPESIVRKDTPDKKLTPTRQDVIEVIDEIRERDDWPLQYQEIAERAGCSRQTVSNVVSWFYEPVGSAENGTESEREHDATDSVDIPNDPLKAFLKGYEYGKRGTE